MSQDRSTRAHPHVRTIVVASTFTADRLLSPLEFWMDTLEIPAEICLAPYGQLMQELLNPQSALSSNRSGINILLIRPEDWIRDLPAEEVEANRAHLKRVTEEVGEALAANRSMNPATLLVGLCPPSSTGLPEYAEALRASQEILITRVRSLRGAYCFTHAELTRLYPVTTHEDVHADRLAHIPYANDYFVALATFTARRIALAVKPRFKVIAIDCDNTLWKGICGEDGPDGIELTASHLELQKMLVRQHDAGVLLCLCSKNNQADVAEVFRRHPEMPLREEHLIASRVNWAPKSQNLHSLSEELGLGLDSFILLDDSPAECAEVLEGCPDVLSIQVPSDAQGMRQVLEHTWAFDLAELTEEGRQRTAQYKANRSRQQAMHGAGTLEKFLESLELRVDVFPLQPADLPRVAELIQRTNQFNLTTIRRSAADIEGLWKSGELEVRAARVRDRFGDYGLVGTVLLRHELHVLEIDTFVLSCRVLGRGVEHRIVNEIGRMAQERGLAQIVLRYRRTSRNAPAWTFLEKSFGAFQLPSPASGAPADETVFRVPAGYAATVDLKSSSASGIVTAAAGETKKESQKTASPRWHEAVRRFARVGDVTAALARRTSKPRKEPAEYAVPGNAAEAAVAGIWAEVLGVPRVGAQDDFFHLGGDSLLAVQVIARMASELGAELSIYEFFESPTVEQIAARLPSASEAAAPIQPTGQSEDSPLSWAQQRLWFIDRLEGSSVAYHVPITLRIRGALDLEALQSALDSIVRRHETLRAVVATNEGTLVHRSHR
jgi:FkbH-like protein